MPTIKEYVEFNIPPETTKNEHTKLLLDEAHEIVERIDGEEITETAIFEGKKLLERADEKTPHFKEYEKIVQKYGYLPRISDPVTYILGKARGKYVDDGFIKEINNDFIRRRAYNIFTPIANVPPTNLAKPFEQMMIDVLNKYITTSHPVTLDDTPYTRYDAYVPDYDIRIEVKTTRLIDATKKGDMGKRFLPYGLGKKFATGIKQVKLIYFDALIMNIVASNVSLYALYTHDDVKRIIIDNFVDGKKKVRAGLIHNTDKTPKEKDKRLKRIYTDEFIFTFSNYEMMGNMLEYARYVTFDINDLAKQTAKLIKNDRIERKHPPFGADNE